MLQAVLANPNFTNELSDVYVLTKDAQVLSKSVLEHFQGHPNSFAKVEPDKIFVVTGTGQNGELQKLSPREVPQAVLDVQAEMLKTIASTKAEWEQDRIDAKSEGRDPKFNGFDGIRLNILDCYEEDNKLHIVIAESTYTLRAAAAKVAQEISEGKRPIDDLMINGKIFQPAEFHAGAIMFTSEGLMVAQVKGLADGAGKIHLNLAGGGVEKHHVKSDDTVSEGLNAEIEEEIGNVRKFGLKAEKLGIGYERVSLGDSHAITNYQGIIHQLCADEGWISNETMKEIASQQFASFAEKFRAVEEQKQAEANDKGLDYKQKTDLELATIWEVGGYPLINFRDKNSITIKDGELLITSSVIRPVFNRDGMYSGTRIYKERLAVQPTIAPQIVYYSQIWSDYFA